VKLACLNALSCVVTLRFHQIEYLDNGDLPEKLDDSLVFGTENISAIRASILQLHDDKLLLKQRKRYLLFASVITILLSSHQHIAYNYFERMYSPLGRVINTLTNKLTNAPFCCSIYNKQQFIIVSFGRSPKRVLGDMSLHVIHRMYVIEQMLYLNCSL